MRENDGVDLMRRTRQRLPVAFPPLLQSLEQTAVHEHLKVSGVDQVLGTGDCACSTQELDIGHSASFLVICNLYWSRIVRPVYFRDASVVDGHINRPAADFNSGCDLSMSGNS